MENSEYKKYSLERLEEWVYNAITSGGATPREVYETIIGVVEEQSEYHNNGAKYTGELLSLLRQTNQYTGSTVSSVVDQVRKEGGYGWTPESKEDRVSKWVLPVEETVSETGETEYFITFPDELLDVANLSEGDTVEWVDNQNGSYTLKKVESQSDNSSKTFHSGWFMPSNKK